MNLIVCYRTIFQNWRSAQLFLFLLIGESISEILRILCISESFKFTPVPKNHLHQLSRFDNAHECAAHSERIKIIYPASRGKMLQQQIRRRPWFDLANGSWRYMASRPRKPPTHCSKINRQLIYRPEHNIASGRRLVVGRRVPRYNNGPSSISSLDGSAIANNACRIARPRGIWYVDMRKIWCWTWLASAAMLTSYHGMWQRTRRRQWWLHLLTRKQTALDRGSRSDRQRYHPC